MLRDVRIDENGIDGVTEARRQEWRLAAADLLEEHGFSRPDAFTLEVRVEGGDAVLDAAFDEIARTVRIPASVLSPHLDEYAGICRTLARLDDEGAASPRLEALDMAKKVAHDAAARTLITALREGDLSPDHPTARRLFTLLLTLLVDTTRLTLRHGHRR